jgi:hypothetical protein
LVRLTINGAQPVKLFALKVTAFPVETVTVPELAELEHPFKV